MFLTDAELADLSRPWKATGQVPIEWFQENFRSFVFSPKHIVTNALPYAPGRGEWAPGIYFLIDDGLIVYVGKSTTIARRLDSHYAGPKRFTHFWCFTMPELFLTHVENYYTNLFRPFYNIDIRCPDDFIRQHIEVAEAEDADGCS